MNKKKGVHIPLIHPNAGHFASWTVASEEPAHSQASIADEYCDQQWNHELQDCKFCIVFFGLLSCQSYQAHPAWTGAFWEVALDEEGDWEDGVEDQDEGGEDNPLELQKYPWA